MNVYLQQAKTPLSIDSLRQLPSKLYCELHFFFYSGIYLWIYQQLASVFTSEILCSS